MHEKCILLRLETVIFSVMGPSNLNVQHRRFGLDLLIPSYDGLCRQTQILQNIHNHVCTRLYVVLIQTTLRILTTVSTSDPVPKIIKNWNIDGNVTLENWIIEQQFTGCPRRNGQNFGRVFLMLNYTDITQNTYIQSWAVTEIMAREVWNFDSCYTLIDYQIHIKTGRNMWFL